jgi:hypothetical protein
MIRGFVTSIPTSSRWWSESVYWLNAPCENFYSQNYLNTGILKGKELL